MRLGSWRPVFRSMAVYACLYPSANIVQQLLSHPSRSAFDQVDFGQAGRFFVYGSCFHAPLVFYGMHMLGSRFPGISAIQLIKKVVMDQLLFAPVALSCFYVGLAAFEFKSPNEIYEEWRAKFPKTWETSACIWPFLQLINFRFVSPPNRAVFVGVMSFFWTILLSFWKNAPVPHTEEKFT